MACLIYLLLVPSLHAVCSAQLEQEAVTSNEVACPQDAFSALQIKTSFERRSGDDNASDKTGGWQGIQIVGAGLSRTGTESLVEALTSLGHRPSHGEEFKVFGNRTSNVTVIGQAMFGNMTDLLAVLAAEKIDSVFDEPLQSFADEFVTRYNSKVILSVHPRGADGWVDSVQHFARFWPIYSTYPTPRLWTPANGSISCVVPVSPNLTIDRSLREKCKKAYNEYNANIIKHFPTDRLLVYSVASHWGPLVKFLGQPIPTKAGRPIPFPHSDNVADKIILMNKCGFCNMQVNGHKPMPSDVNLIPPDVYKNASKNDAGIWRF